MKLPLDTIGHLSGLVLRFPSSQADRVAVEHLDRQLTYAELRAAVLACAAHLCSLGVRPADRVVLVLENSLDYAVTLFAILAVGAVAVPLSPDTTPKALGFVLDHSNARGYIAREQLRLRLGLPPALLSLDATFDANRRLYTGFAATPDASAFRSTDIAAVLYTSGTTGHPKGVLLTHANLLANTRSIVEYMRLTPRDSTVTVLPFFHSFGNSVLLTHLAVGARVLIENRFAFPAKLIETMQRARPTGFSGVPTTFYILTHRTSFLRQDWSFLRYISQAGGPMRVDTIRQLREALPSTEIHVMYGQTEAAARLSTLPPSEVERKIGSIGQAIPGVELRIVDAEGRETAPEEVGEITARGANIMAGYLNDPEATASTIRNGWLYTGDMARRDAEGFIYIVSRKSDFIKTASYRVSPGEIEEVIAQLPKIEDVAVFGVPDDLLGEAIVACVASPPGYFDADAIRNHCLGALPFFKVPKYILHEPDIPKTASGKKRYFVLRERHSGLKDQTG